MNYNHIEQLRKAVSIVKTELSRMKFALKNAGWRDEGVLDKADTGVDGINCFTLQSASPYQNRCYSFPTITVDNNLVWVYDSAAGEVVDGFGATSLGDFLETKK